MEIIPVINCLDFKSVEEKIKKAAAFLPEGGWLHFDISDGKFTKAVIWNNPEELKEAGIEELKKLKIEVHLMVENPEEFIGRWIDAGAKRVIVHLEAIKNKDEQEILKWADRAEIGLAIEPLTPLDNLIPHLFNFKFVLFLSVFPGYSGQSFDSSALEKIKYLKTNFPDIRIEVDGGITLGVAKLAKEAGADVVASASYIWGNSISSVEAYQNLSAF